MKTQYFYMWLWVANPQKGFPKHILTIRKVNMCLN